MCWLKIKLFLLLSSLGWASFLYNYIIGMNKISAYYEVSIDLFSGFYVSNNVGISV